ncbi:serine protease Do [Cerasibacillus quisquiliarum]|uniref:Putative serine protease YyxA n=1 Tax=Cerasibacillus quisquiliarum TaxID=227865 RepID=A0A511UYQ7_9BACI|nr:trypsin-like peptidase domain-containing protein [Cerasibacillus quisquiliarum]MBB5146904.1 serine protease Do [Cerasibacillus quisquiliarum]GEN31774.1 putative serine protease YyxA [Cerasibacillus quisquiliarum]
MRHDDMKPYNQSEANHHDENETKRDVAETDTYKLKQEESLIFNDGQGEQHTHSNQLLTPASNDEYNNQQMARQSSHRKTNHSSRFNIGAFFSGMIGGLIPVIVAILLIMNHVLPLPISGNEQPQQTPIKEEYSEEVVSNISSDDAEVSTDISEVSDAVVGVLNLQQRSIWEPSEEVGSGSGIVYKKKDGYAYIVTNEHVVQDAQELEIVFNDDKRADAKVLGTDKLTDLAVLKIDGKHVKTIAKLGDSEKLKVGETVFAIGNPLGIEFANSLTKGIISGLNRSISVDTNGDGQPDWITEVIQTDAAINPGNSGGALVNKNGDVIGINSMKVARHAVEGIGLAIPIDAALPIMKQLETNGEVVRPFIGISSAPLSDVPPQYRNQIVLPKNIEGGMVIANVEVGSPADKAGLKQFDIITKINGQKVTSILELRKFLYTEANVNEKVTIEFYRDGKKQEVELKLTERSI